MWGGGVKAHFEWGVMCRFDSDGPCVKFPIMCDDHEAAIDKLEWFDSPTGPHRPCGPHRLVFRWVGPTIEVVQQ